MVQAPVKPVAPLSPVGRPVLVRRIQSYLRPRNTRLELSYKKTLFSQANVRHASFELARAKAAHSPLQYQRDQHSKAQFWL